jgi:hypothetical protein
MRRSKYGNVPTIVDGIRFDSMLESKRYAELKLLAHAKAITGLQVHPRYPLEVNGQKICIYEADFAYTDSRGTVHVEDTKGAKTALYSLKKKLMRACHGIEIEEARPRA